MSNIFENHAFQKYLPACSNLLSERQRREGGKLKIGGAAGNRTPVQPVYSMRVYRHSLVRPSKFNIGIINSN